MNDLRYAIRLLLKSPGFSVVAVLTLAMGIGANTAMFSIIDAIALRPLAVTEPERIVRIANLKNTGAYDGNDSSSLAEFEEFRAKSRQLSGIAGVDRRQVLLRQGEDVRRLLANVVSPSYFDVFGVRPELGRMFTEAELQRADAPHIVVFSYEFWKRQFNADPQIVGRTVIANDLDCLVLGILPRSFRGTASWLNPDVYVPLTTWDAMSGNRRSYAARDYRALELFGRLQPGATADQAQAELVGIQKGLAEQFPKTDSDRRIAVRLDRDVRDQNAKGLSYLLFSIAGLVLLIACANITNLLLARGEARRKEIATRLALGAGRSRLVRQFVTESLVLAVVAAAFALLLANWVVDLLPALMPPTSFPIGFDFRMDLRVLAFALITSLIAVLIAGILPAASAARVELTGAMKEQTTITGRRGYLRHALVVAEIAISAVLLIGAGLLVRTFVALRSRDPGFDQNRKMLVLTLDLGKGTREHEFDRQALQRLSALPGVQGAALAGRIPLWGSGGGANRVVWVPGVQSAPGDEGVHVGFTVVSPAYFSTIGTALLRGRAIDYQDNETAPRVAVLNQSAAHLLWPTEDAIGKHLRMGGPQGKDVEVIGLVPDGQYVHLREAQKPYMFLAALQENYGAGVLLVATASDPRPLAATVRRELRAIDPNVLVLETITMDDHMRFALYEDRLQAQLVGAMGGLGLVLAAVGLYGVVAYMVNRRTREIGIRIAIGATPRSVYRMVVTRGLLLTGIGVGIGVVAALVFAKVLAELVYGVSPRDPLTFVLVVLVLTAVALLASFMPARRASRVDPMVALRYD